MRTHVLHPVAEASHMHSYCLGPETVCTQGAHVSRVGVVISPSSPSPSLSLSLCLYARQKSVEELHPLLAMFLLLPLAASGLPRLKVKVQIF